MAAFFFSMQSLPLLTIIGIFLSGVAWLVPNHYPPWTGAWSEAVSIAGLLLMLPAIVTDQAHRPALSRTLIAVIGLSCSVIIFQFLIGKLYFAGDALLAMLYIGLWGGGVLAGRHINHHAEAPKLVAILASTWVVAAFVSVVIALNQWTGALDLQIYSADLPLGVRPFANLAQPNHFCTLCFIGLCALLLLFEQRLLGPLSTGLVASTLMFGMVASQSRTGWLQIAWLLLWFAVSRRRVALRTVWFLLGPLATAFVLLSLAWTSICSFLMLPIGRSGGEQLQAGARIPYWLEMFDAIGREPLLGYGWLQTAAAQVRVAIDHPVIGAAFHYSHNLLLDLLLWNGLPIGLLLIALLATWLIRRISCCNTARNVFLVAMMGGILLHGLLEYPLAYAYFLVPLGLIMGLLEAAPSHSNSGFALHKVLLSFGMVAFTGLWIAVGIEYARLEERFRTFRYELAGIVVSEASGSIPTGRLLTQQESFLKFYQISAKPGMSPAQVESMRQVAERFGFSALLLRYALAEGLNGQPEIASRSLETLCHIHLPRKCHDAVEEWKEMQERFPELPAPPARLLSY